MQCRTDDKAWVNYSSALKEMSPFERGIEEQAEGADEANNPMSFLSNKDYSRFPSFARFAHLHFDDLSAKKGAKKAPGRRNSA